MISDTSEMSDCNGYYGYCCRQGRIWGCLNVQQNVFRARVPHMYTTVTAKYSVTNYQFTNLGGLDPRKQTRRPFHFCFPAPCVGKEYKQLYSDSTAVKSILEEVDRPENERQAI